MLPYHQSPPTPTRTPSRDEQNGNQPEEPSISPTATSELESDDCHLTSHEESVASDDCYPLYSSIPNGLKSASWSHFEAPDSPQQLPTPPEPMTPRDPSPPRTCLPQGHEYELNGSTTSPDAVVDEKNSSMGGSSGDKNPFIQHLPVTLWDYLVVELMATELDGSQEAKSERVVNFLSVPFAVEKVSKEHALTFSLADHYYQKRYRLSLSVL
jgi:hypothetical protein